ncbi:MAG: polysaccharide biosynthesis/export family protein [Bacteroidota bacterium]
MVRFRMMPMLLLLAISAASPLPAQVRDYVIGKGDRLLITVWGFPEFTTAAEVREDGLISIPLAGEIQAAGLPKEAFMAALRTRLAEYIQGEIRLTVSALASGSRRVTILGAVPRPDTYPVEGPMSLLEVLASAGGSLPEADLGRVRVFRKGSPGVAEVVDLEAFMEDARMEALPSIGPGDVVHVPLRRNFLKDFGEYMGSVLVFFALFRVAEGF